MITKINKIKNLGLVFSDFGWKAGVPPFKRFNIIYGWNGCGKTTLSRLFSAIGGNKIDKLEYEFELDGGPSYKHIDEFPGAIRVFNQDYVQENVKILESQANSISILLGAENKELIEQIAADEILLLGDPKDPSDKGAVLEFNDYTKKKGRKESEKEVLFSDIAKTIGAATIGSGEAARNYRSPNAKTDFAALTTKAELSNEDLEQAITSVRQELLPVEDLIRRPEIALSEEEMIDFEEALNTALSDAGRIMKATVESEVIARLTDNPDISEWVEKGMHLHEVHASTSCEFCGNQIPPERLKQLLAHFNDEDKKLKEKIDSVIFVLNSAQIGIEWIKPPETAALYKELRPGLDSAKQEYLASKEALLEEIKKLVEELQGKKTQTTKSLPLKSEVKTSAFAEKINLMNEIINKHNKKSVDFQKVKSDAVLKLKNHYLSTIFDDVKDRERQITELETDLARRDAEIQEIRRRILENKGKISSTYKACEKINEGLKTFLGRSELTFIPNVEKVVDENGEEKEVDAGYRIMRGTVPAEHLSEGEKTAIAFVYFVVHLNDGNFPTEEGYVVIDDPISSLDSNSLYQAHSFLKNTVKDCKQVFILTHNFDFLKLLLNWRKGADGRGPKETEYFMLKNDFVGAERKASIDEMDVLLRKYETEYQYLFKLLKEMNADQDGTLLKAYPVPNVARKVWDSFLMFRVPDGNGIYVKNEFLKGLGHDAQKLDAIYKFTNDQSHITGAGFDPALVPETKKVIGEILEMMEALSPDHFAILDKATT